MSDDNTTTTTTTTTTKAPGESSPLLGALTEPMAHDQAPPSTLEGGERVLEILHHVVDELEDAAEIVGDAGAVVATKGVSVWTDFTDFVGKGNVVQTAIAFIVGGAFSTIVESLVNDLLMPPLGLLTGANFADHFMVLQYGASKRQGGSGGEGGEGMASMAARKVQRTLFSAAATRSMRGWGIGYNNGDDSGEQPGKNNDEYDTLAEAIADGAVCIKYGLFAQKLFDFLTIALVLFLVIRTFQKLARAAVDLVDGDDDEAEPVVVEKHERPCPECLSEIPDRAKRCRFCASAVKPLVVDEEEEAAAEEEEEDDEVKSKKGKKKDDGDDEKPSKLTKRSTKRRDSDENSGEWSD